MTSYVYDDLWILALLGFLYFFLFEGSPLRATPGKRLLGLRVLDMQQRRLGWGRSLLRSIARILSILTLMFGYLSMVLSE